MKTLAGFLLVCASMVFAACQSLDSRGDVFVANESGTPVMLIFRHRDGREVQYAIGAREGILTEKKDGIPVSYLIRGGASESAISRAEVDAAKAEFSSGIVVLVVERETFSIKRPVKEKPNQSTQRNAGSRPSSGDSPVSETPSSLGPRG